MILGFTGTRTGMSAGQKGSFARLVAELRPEKFYHGDAVGADDEAAEIVYRIMGPECQIFACVGSSASQNDRAHNPHSTVIVVPGGHHARNRFIVEASERMTACPRSDDYDAHSGTWWTYSYVYQKTGKPVTLIARGGQETTMQTIT